MSKVHVLERLHVSEVNRFRCIVHAATPTGNNAAGAAWVDVMLASGRSGTTRMSEGNGDGQIAIAEKQSITQGSLLEFEFELEVDAQGVVAARDGTLDAMIATAIAEMQADLQEFGRVVA